MVDAMLALDKFKGTFSALEICAVLAEILNEQGINADIAPMADGGDGTLDALNSAGFETINISASDAIGRVHDCRYVIRDNQAVIELASTCGMQTIQDVQHTSEYNAWEAGTFGLGEAATWALGVVNPHDPDRPRTIDPAFPPTITVAVGGSASIDGGIGFLQALGFVINDQGGNQVPPNALGLIAASSIVPPSHLAELTETKWEVLVDVENPALGPLGAAAVFGPQKGFNETECIALEAGLMNWIEILASTFNKDPHQIAEQPGAGAAGAITTALVAALDAEVIPGAQAIADAIDFEIHLKYADVVIVGEGQLDDQTPNGKAPSEAAKRATEAGKAVIAFVGQDRSSEETKQALNLKATITLENHGQNLFAAGNELATTIQCLVNH